MTPFAITRHFLSVDLGKVRDFTAIALLEHTQAPGAWDPVQLAHRKEVTISLRHLERVPLGTPYAQVAEQLRDMTSCGSMRGRCELIVDATGAGDPVVELIRYARIQCPLWPVMITSGNLETRERGYWFVPKRNLITGLQVILQQEELRIANGMEYGPTLVKEMMDMQVRVSDNRNEQYAAWREGQHDDLVLAVAMGIWCVRKQYPPSIGPSWWRPQQGPLL